MMTHFFCKLKPPRADFLADMSEEEALVMRRHREYWMPRVEIGVVIAMGPVADPAGAYGVAIVEAASRSRARFDAAVRSRDPLWPWIFLRDVSNASAGGETRHAAGSDYLRHTLINEKGAVRRENCHGHRHSCPDTG